MPSLLAPPPPSRNGCVRSGCSGCDHGWIGRTRRRRRTTTRIEYYDWRQRRSANAACPVAVAGSARVSRAGGAEGASESGTAHPEAEMPAHPARAVAATGREGLAGDGRGGCVRALLE